MSGLLKASANALFAGVLVGGLNAAVDYAMFDPSKPVAPVTALSNARDIGGVAGASVFGWEIGNLLLGYRRRKDGPSII